MEVVLYQQQGAVAWITLNRPEKFNSFTRALALELQQALDRCREDDTVRAVCITGAGRAFCAGQDLAEVLTLDDNGLSTILLEQLNPVIEKITALEKPVICAVNGVAAGAGANVALACDITLAAESAAFIQAFSKIGLIPDSGGTFTLPRLIGLQRATALMMLGDKISASEAQQMGMIYKVLPDSELVTAAQSLCERLAAMPTRALALTKKALQLSAGNTLSEQLAAEEMLQSIAGRTADYKEGVKAFVEKRSPVFTGK